MTIFVPWCQKTRLFLFNYILHRQQTVGVCTKETVRVLKLQLQADDIGETPGCFLKGYFIITKQQCAV
jgi:hypothetical protein